MFASLDAADAGCAPDHVTTIHTALQVSRQDPGAPRQHSSGTRVASDQRGRRLEGDASEQSIRILDTPLWHPDFVHNQLAATCAVQATLLDKDHQSARPSHCVVAPCHFAPMHDDSLQKCLSQLLNVNTTDMIWDVAYQPHVRNVLIHLG